MKSGYVYDDCGCVFIYSWDSKEYSSAYMNDDLKKIKDGINSGDIEVLYFARLYKEKRKIYKFCTPMEKIALTLPESYSEDAGVMASLAPVQSAVITPVPTVVITLVPKK